MSTDWPDWATQRIEIVDPDPGWGELASELIRGLERLLGPRLDRRVEHVGSTAVPGLPAKPIVDLMAPVAAFPPEQPAGDRLTGAGWHLVPPELDARPWRRLYVLPDGDRRLAHLQLVPRCHPRWRETIAFRDALRADAELALRYAELKRTAADAHPDDREAYTQAKGDFIRGVVEQAI